MKNNKNNENIATHLQKEPAANPADIADEKKSTWFSFTNNIPKSKTELKEAANNVFETTKRYFTESSQNDNRSAPGKMRDAAISLATSPTVAFNLANIFFCAATNNPVGTAISSTMTAVSSGMTVIDSWKNRPESSSYKANAIYQGSLGLSYLPKLASADPTVLIDAAKGIGMYSFATAGHWLRASEEKEAEEAGLSMDEYYQAFSKGPGKYSQTYYGVTEFIAVNSAHDPSAVASVLALAGIGRALNDQKFWDLEGTKLQALRQATAPRIFGAGYAISATTAALQGDFMFAASQVGWGWGNLNFDLIGPKVKKAIKNKYANEPELAQNALDNLKTVKEELKEIKEETTFLADAIQNQNWDGAAQEAIDLYEDAQTHSRRNLYSEYIKAISPASHFARKYLDSENISWKDLRSISEKETEIDLTPEVS
ncbi:MAG: hypothetical protein ACRBDI_10365 [Alphaproteobacteria bacterium]